MKLVSIEVVTEINPHPEDSQLELAIAGGWQSTVQKGKYRIGEKIVLIVVDSLRFLHSWGHVFAREKARGDRIKKLNLNAPYAQGLILPITVLPEHIQHREEGSDVGRFLGIKPPPPSPTDVSRESLEQFPTYICPITTEDDGLLNKYIVAEVLRNKNITVTQKPHGASCTIIIENQKITHVCSHRYLLKEANDDNTYWKVARKLEKPTSTKDRYVLQGELMGPNIHGNEYCLNDFDFYVFQINREGQFLNYWDMVHECVHTFNCRYVKHVKDYDSEKEKVNLSVLQQLANEQNLPDGSPAEGIVVRPSSYRTSGYGRPLGFKLTNSNYILLK